MSCPPRSGAANYTFDNARLSQSREHGGMSSSLHAFREYHAACIVHVRCCCSDRPRPLIPNGRGFHLRGLTDAARILTMHLPFASVGMMVVILRNAQLHNIISFLTHCFRCLKTTIAREMQRMTLLSF